MFSKKTKPLVPLNQPVPTAQLITSGRTFVSFFNIIFLVVLGTSFIVLAWNMDIHHGVCHGRGTAFCQLLKGLPSPVPNILLSLFGACIILFAGSYLQTRLRQKLKIFIYEDHFDFVSRSFHIKLNRPTTDVYLFSGDSESMLFHDTKNLQSYHVKDTQLPTLEWKKLRKFANPQLDALKGKGLLRNLRHPLAVTQ